jgi:hypothetical protein
MKVFNLRMSNHEEHEGHEEKCVKNFVFSAIASALLYLGNRSLRCSRSLFPTRFYLPHPWGRTSCILASRLCSSW